MDCNSIVYSAYHALEKCDKKETEETIEAKILEEVVKVVMRSARLIYKLSKKHELLLSARDDIVTIHFAIHLLVLVYRYTLLTSKLSLTNLIINTKENHDKNKINKRTTTSSTTCRTYYYLE